MWKTKFNDPYTQKQPQHENTQLGPVVQKPINANPRLKINQGAYFSTPKYRST